MAAAHDFFNTTTYPTVTPQAGDIAIVGRGGVAKTVDLGDLLSGGAALGTANTWTALQTLNAGISGADIYYNVKAFGAVGDGRRVYDAAITSGLAVLTSATAAFTSADVGKAVLIDGAGAAGVALPATISSFTNSTTVTISTTAGTTVTNARLVVGTDDTAAIQLAVTTAMAAVANGNHVIVYSPHGIYVLAGALTGDAQARGQIVLPNVSDNGVVSHARPGTVKFLGQCSPCDLAGDSATAFGASGGTIWESVIYPSGALGGNVLSTHTTGNFGSFNFVCLFVESMCFVLPPNPTVGAINARYAQEAIILDVVVDARARNNYGAIQPTNTLTYGLQCPAFNNGARAYVRNFTAMGVYTGLTASEHFNGDDLHVLACMVGLELQSTNFSAVVGRYLVQNCQMSIFTNGSPCFVTVNQYDVERDSNVSRWTGQNILDVGDVGNNVEGHIRWLTSTALTGRNRDLRVTGGKKIHFQEHGTTEDAFDGLLGFWAGGEASSAERLDSTPNRLNLENVGGATLSSSGTLFAAASSQYLRRFMTKLSNCTRFAIGGWFQRTGSGDAVHMGQTDGTSNNRVHITLNTDGNVYFVVGRAGTAFGSAALAGTGIHHLVLVFDGLQAGNSTRLVGYVDGAAVALSFTGTIPNAAPVLVGNFEVGRINLGTITYSNGLMKDWFVMIGRAPTATEVATLYNSGTPFNPFA